ncbi:MAG: hypothetical protein Q7S87_12860 [Agitococcus sp.]|jgi:hypothetical protein|nr:hypothetical protein [Agitococcus sp.]
MQAVAIKKLEGATTSRKSATKKVSSITESTCKNLHSGVLESLKQMDQGRKPVFEKLD